MKVDLKVRAAQICLKRNISPLARMSRKGVTTRESSMRRWCGRLTRWGGSIRRARQMAPDHDFVAERLAQTPTQRTVLLFTTQHLKAVRTLLSNLLIAFTSASRAPYRMHAIGIRGTAGGYRSHDRDARQAKRRHARVVHPITTHAAQQNVRRFDDHWFGIGGSVGGVPLKNPTLSIEKSAIVVVAWLPLTEM